MSQIARRRRTLDIWPGFVDALSALLLVVIFVLLVFTLGHYSLSNALQGRERALERLDAETRRFADEPALVDALFETATDYFANVPIERAKDVLGNPVEEYVAARAALALCAASPRRMGEFARTYHGPNPDQGPEVQDQPLPACDEPDEALLHKRFAEAVLTRKKGRLLVPAAEGMWSAQTIYGIFLSGYLGKKVKLPVSAARYDKMLADLIARARPVQRGEADSAEGMAATL